MIQMTAKNEHGENVVRIDFEFQHDCHLLIKKITHKKLLLDLIPQSCSNKKINFINDN